MYNYKVLISIKIIGRKRVKITQGAPTEINISWEWGFVFYFYWVYNTKRRAFRL